MGDGSWYTCWRQVVAGVILLGTEPRVGKTYASILLLQELLRLGQNPAYFKFAATGFASLERS